MLSNGMKLIYDSTAGYYRTEVEGGFTKFEGSLRLGFIATDKKGTKYYYGKDEGANVWDPANGTRNYRMALNKVQDVFGNTMTIYYIKDGNQIYPQRIVYTTLEGPNTALIGAPGAAEVVFEYQNALKSTTSYMSGFKIVNNLILKSITTYQAPGVRQNKYVFNYKYSNATSKNLLESIQQFGTTDTALAPKVTFTYNENPQGFISGSFSAPAGIGFAIYANGRYTDRGYRVADVNADGFSDFVYNYGDCTYASPSPYKDTLINSKAGGFFNSGDWRTTGLPGFAKSCTDIDRDYGYTIVDVDGDAYPDLLRNFRRDNYWGSSGQYQKFTRINNQSNNFVDDPAWVLPDEAYLSFEFGEPSYEQEASGGTQIQDINGDSYPDIVLARNIVYPNQTSSHSVYINNKANGSKGWTKSTTWSTPAEVDFTQGDTLVDLNGDGLPDIFSSNGTTIKIWMNYGDRFVVDSASVWNTTLPYIPNIREGKTRFIDVNSDGLADFVHLTGGGSSVYLNTGYGWNTVNQTAWAFDSTAAFNNSGTQLLDLNGDGALDYMVALVGGPLKVYYNTSTKPDTLIKVDNGLSVTSSITYKSSATFTKQFMPFSLQVVDNIALTSGSRTYTTRYAYEGGYYDITDREFRGFAKFTTYDADNNYTISYQFTKDHFRKGMSYQQESYDATGKMLGKVESFMGLLPIVDPVVKFPYLLRKDTYAYGNDGLLKNRSAEQYNYNFGTGDVVTKVQYGSIDTSAYSLPTMMFVNPSTTPEYYTNPDKYDPIKITALDNNVLRTDISYVDKAGSPFMTLPYFTTIRDKAGNYIKKTSFYYDNATVLTTAFTNGLLTKKEEWTGDTTPALVTTYAYDVIGNLTSTTDALGKTTSITYDSTYKMFPVTTTNAKGQVVKTYYYGVNQSELAADPKYNAGLSGLFGQVIAVIDANGQKVFKSYDSLGRPVLVYGPNDTFALPTSENAYTYGSNYVQVLSKSRITSGAAATLDSSDFIDGLGRVILSKKRAATAGQYVVASQKVYNNRGLVEKSFLPTFTANDLNTIDPIPADTQAHTKYFYDSKGQLIKTINPDGSYSDTTYDVFKTTIMDPSGHRNVANYDSFGRLISREEYLGADGRDVVYPASAFSLYATTQYQYDAQGNLTKVIDAKGNQTTISYDTLGRKTSMNDPDMKTWSYTYDNNGNLLTQTDAKALKTTFAYDVLNRLATKSTPAVGQTAGLNVTYTYDDPLLANSLGRLTKATYNGGNASFNYDTLGRETSSSKVIAGYTYSVNRTYDNLNRLTKVVYPDATNIGYVYDAAGNAFGANVLNSDGTVKNQLVKSVEYNAMGQTTKIVFGNNVSTQYFYDTTSTKLNRILTTNSSAVKLQDLTYTYDRVGNITSITDAVYTATQAFKYDALNRLTQAIGTGYGTKNYTYDQIGNITQKDGLTYTYGGVNGGPHAVTATSDGSTYTYDLNGNMATKRTTKGLWTYSYNQENRLANITYAPNLKATKLISTYAYDGDGARTQKTVYRYSDTDYNNTDTYGYLVTQVGAPVIVAPSMLTSVATYYIGNLYEIEGTRRTNNVFLGSTRIAAITGTEIDYYHTDHLGSTNVISDSVGATRSLTEYDPYGKISRFEKFGTKIQTGWQYFNGKQLDDESGLLFYGGRYYDPKLGRFLTADIVVQDPTGNPQTLNRYTYCNNNPVNNIDPSGHNWFSSFIKGLVQAVLYTVLAPIITPIGAGLLVGALGGGLSGKGWNWSGALMGAAMGGLGGAAFGTTGSNGFLKALGPKVGLGLLVAGAGVAGGTGGLEGLLSFGAGVAGAITGAGIGNGVNNTIKAAKVGSQSNAGKPANSINSAARAKGVSGTNTPVGTKSNTTQSALNTDVKAEVAQSQGLDNKGARGKLKIIVRMDDGSGDSVYDSQITGSVENKANSLTGNGNVQKNYERFVDSLPSKSGQPEIIPFGEGSVAFQAKVPANNIPGSYAVYEKQVDMYGRTMQFTKTTYNSDGQIVHVKDKISGETITSN